MGTRDIVLCDSNQLQEQHHAATGGHGMPMIHVLPAVMGKEASFASMTADS